MTGQGEDILAWLNTAICEREARAKSAAISLAGSSEASRWQQDRDDHRGGYRVHRPALRPGATTPPLTDAVPESVAFVFGESEAAHIVANDPKSVLRRCTADRKAVALYTETVSIRDRAAVTIQAAQERGVRPDPCVLDDWSRANREAAFMLPLIRILAEGCGWTEGER